LTCLFLAVFFLLQTKNFLDVKCSMWFSNSVNSGMLSLSWNVFTHTPHI
jgi:hypothetical protein